MSVTLRTSVGELALTGDSYLRLPGRGNWTAICEMTSFAMPEIGEPATISVLPEARENEPAPTPDTFVGTVRHRRAVPGSETLVVRVVGGAGRLFASLPPADHVAGATVLPAGLVLRKIADAAGERLAPGVEEALDAYLLPRWHRAGGTSARDAIDILIYDLAASTGLEIGWRMLADGTIWAGVETWPDASGSFLYTDQDPDDGVVEFAPSGAPIRPGTTVQGERAVEVFYQFASPKVRARVRHAVLGDPVRVASQAVTDIYRASYGARVEAQRDDGTLDLVCDDARMGELLSVPFRSGAAGMAHTFPAGASGVGARVRLRFQDASPRGAYASDVDQDPNATHAIALVADNVTIGTLAIVAPAGTLGGPCTITFTPTGGTPSVGPTATLTGVIAGPGHKYVKGVRGS